MKYLLILITMIIATVSYSQEQQPMFRSSKSFSLFDVKEANMEYHKFKSGYRDGYLIDKDGTTPIRLEDGGELNLNVRLLNYIYFDNKFHFASDESKSIRQVGWLYEVGIKLPYIDVFANHHSQHGVEYISPQGDRFPVQDYYGVRFKFIGE